MGEGVCNFAIGERVGIGWLGHTCGHCLYSHVRSGEPLRYAIAHRIHPDGGFATHAVADAAFAFKLPDDGDPIALAPLLCAGLIGWRSLVAAGPGARLESLGSGRPLISLRRFAFGRRDGSLPSRVPEMSRRRILHVRSARPGPADRTRSRLSGSTPPSSLRPPGDLVPVALRAVNKGGRVVCGGIHMSDIPQSPPTPMGRAADPVCSRDARPGGAHATFWPLRQRLMSEPKQFATRWRPPILLFGACAPAMACGTSGRTGSAKPIRPSN